MRYEVHILTEDGWVNAYEPYNHHNGQFKTKKEAAEIMQLNIECLEEGPANFKIIKTDTIRKKVRQSRKKHIPTQEPENTPETSEAINWKDLVV